MSPRTILTAEFALSEPQAGAAAKESVDFNPVNFARASQVDRRLAARRVRARANLGIWQGGIRLPKSPNDDIAYENAQGLTQPVLHIEAVIAGIDNLDIAYRHIFRVSPLSDGNAV
jgi:hypothetical protein